MRLRTKLGAAALVAAVLLSLVTWIPACIDASINRVLFGPRAVSDRAHALHKELVVADLHTDALMWDRNLLSRGSRGQVDLPRLAAGGVALEVFAVVTNAPMGGPPKVPAAWDRVTFWALIHGWPMRTWFSFKERALDRARRFDDAVARSNGQLVRITSAAELRSFLARRRARPDLVGGLLALEGTYPLEGKLENLDALAAAGFRMMGLTHFVDNPVGGSLSSVEKGGLTPLGRSLIRAMESRGILVDLAHASPQTIDDALAIVERPVIVSHTGVRGTCDNARNLSDDQVRRIAAQGGIIGIGLWQAAVCDPSPAAAARAMRYLADRVGVDHVALGSDFDGAVEEPFDATGLEQLTEALLQVGFTGDEIAKIMGGNVLRILDKTLPP
jgi:membrane dipeptidase